MNIEQATGNAEADPPEIGGRPPTVGKRTTNAPTVSAGVSARMEDEGSSNTGSPVGDVHKSTGTPRGAGRAGRVAERPVVPEKPGNAGGGKGPQARKDATREKGSEMPNNRIHAGDPGSCRSEGSRSRGRGCRGVNRLGDGSKNRRKRETVQLPRGQPLGNAARSSVCETPAGEPNAPHVRFGERGLETWPGEPD